VRILVVDPVEVLMDDVRCWSALLGARMTRARSAAEALDKLRSGNDYDALLLSFDQPFSAGFALILEIRQRAADLPILVYSQLCFNEVRLTALALGAADFVTRPCAADDLVARLRAIARPVLPWNGEEITLGRLHIDLVDRAVMVSGLEVKLTAREFDLLALLAANPDVIVSQQALWRHLTRDAAPIGRKLLSELICDLRRKLTQAGFAGMIGTSQGRGYMLVQRRAPGEKPIRPRDTAPALAAAHGW
jgi:DNA-binding response OmpR family regulator